MKFTISRRFRNARGAPIFPIGEKEPGGANRVQSGWQHGPAVGKGILDRQSVARTNGDFEEITAIHLFVPVIQSRAYVDQFTSSIIATGVLANVPSQ